MTYPATDRHIEKARAAEQEFLVETPEIYNKITKAYIEEQKNFLQWVSPPQVKTSETVFRFIIFWRRTLQSVMKLNELFLKIMIQKMDF